MQPSVKQHTRASRPISWTAGLDWFRWVSNDTSNNDELLETIHVVQSSDTRNGSKVRPWRFQGFDGWQTDRIRYGVRAGRVLWESSGEAAASIAGLTPSSGGYCSRIDLQTTFRLSHSQPTWGTCLTGSWTTILKKSASTRTRHGLSLGTNGLWLGTVGSRTSRSYIRVYDKGVESKMAPAGIMWRLELEAKHEHARELWTKHRQTLNDPAFCGQYCAQSLTELGCSWPFGKLSNSRVDLALGRKESTSVGTLAVWLSRSVAPTIPRLLTVFSVAEVLEMLKLTDVAAPIGNNNAHDPPARTVRAQ